VARVTSTVPRTPAWTVAPANVTSIEAAALLREYFVEVLDRYYHLHLGRPSSPTEIARALAVHPSDDLAPPTGVFLMARYGEDPVGCVGLRVLDPRAVELTRMFVRPGLRGMGGGSRLLAAADEAARRLGAERIVLDTRLDLVEARALYVKHGYAEVPPHNDAWYAEVSYNKELGSSVSSLAR
jgi:GNAT superfamily N-acetyltransferase